MKKLLPLLLMAMLGLGCAWGAQGVVLYQADGETPACEAHVRFLVIGTGENTQVSGACSPYAVTTKDTGFSDNAVVLIPELGKKLAEGVAAGLTGGAGGSAGKAAGMLLERAAEAEGAP